MTLTRFLGALCWLSVLVWAAGSPAREESIDLLGIAIASWAAGIIATLMARRLAQATLAPRLPFAATAPGRLHGELILGLTALGFGFVGFGFLTRVAGLPILIAAAAYSTGGLSHLRSHAHALLREGMRHRRIAIGALAARAGGCAAAIGFVANGYALGAAAVAALAGAAIETTGI